MKFSWKVASIFTVMAAMLRYGAEQWLDLKLACRAEIAAPVLKNWKGQQAKTKCQALKDFVQISLKKYPLVTAQNTESDDPRIEFYDDKDRLLVTIPMMVQVGGQKTDLAFTREHVANIIHGRGITEKMTRLENPYCQFSPAMTSLEYSDADVLHFLRFI